MPRFVLTVLLFAILFSLVRPLRAEDPGQELLDRAVEAKLRADDVLELGAVIQLCQKALKEGLTGENEKIAKQLLASTLYDRGGKFAEAVLDTQPADANELRQLLRIRQTAQADLEQAIELLPEDALGRYYLGRLLALPGGDSEKSEKELTQAIKLSDKDSDLKAKALLARGELPRKPEERRSDYNAAAKLAPGNAEIFRARGLFLLEEEKIEDGLADIDKALRIDPTDAVAHVLRGMGLSAIKKYDEARASFDRALEIESRYSLAYLQRARVHLLQDRGKEALEDLNKVLTLQDPTAAILLLRASAHQILGQDEAALEDVERVLKEQPDLPQAIRAKALLLAGNGKIAEAIGGLEALQKTGKDEVQLQLGLLYAANNQTQKAIETFTEVLKREPSNFSALTSRADAYLRVGKHREAIADYEAALKLRADSSHVLNNLAWVLATSPDDKVRNGKQAIELAKKACEVTQYKEGHIVSTLAAGYAEIGDFETAIKWSTKAVEIGDEDVKEQLAKELESYKAKKPWREVLDKTKPEETKPEDK